MTGGARVALAEVAAHPTPLLAAALLRGMARGATIMMAEVDAVARRLDELGVVRDVGVARAVAELSRRSGRDLSPTFHIPVGLAAAAAASAASAPMLAPAASASAASSSRSPATAVQYVWSRWRLLRAAEDVLAAPTPAPAGVLPPATLAVLQALLAGAAASAASAPASPSYSPTTPVGSPGARATGGAFRPRASSGEGDGWALPVASDATAPLGFGVGGSAFTMTATPPTNAAAAVATVADYSFTGPLLHAMLPSPPSPPSPPVTRAAAATIARLWAPPPPPGSTAPSRRSGAAEGTDSPTDAASLRRTGGPTFEAYVRPTAVASEQRGAWKAALAADVRARAAAAAAASFAATAAAGEAAVAARGVGSAWLAAGSMGGTLPDDATGGFMATEASPNASPAAAAAAAVATAATSTRLNAAVVAAAARDLRASKDRWALADSGALGGEVAGALWAVATLPPTVEVADASDVARRVMSGLAAVEWAPATLLLEDAVNEAHAEVARLEVDALLLATEAAACEARLNGVVGRSRDLAAAARMSTALAAPLPAGAGASTGVDGTGAHAMEPQALVAARSALLRGVLATLAGEEAALVTEVAANPTAAALAAGYDDAVTAIAASAAEYAARAASDDRVAVAAATAAAASRASLQAAVRPGGGIGSGGGGGHGGPAPWLADASASLLSDAGRRVRRSREVALAALEDGVAAYTAHVYWLEATAAAADDEGVRLRVVRRSLLAQLAAADKAAAELVAAEQPLAIAASRLSVSAEAARQRHAEELAVRAQAVAALRVQVADDAGRVRTVARRQADATLVAAAGAAAARAADAGRAAVSAEAEVAAGKVAAAEARVAGELGGRGTEAAVAEVKGRLALEARLEPLAVSLRELAQRRRGVLSAIDAESAHLRRALADIDAAAAAAAERQAAAGAVAAFLDSSLPPASHRDMDTLFATPCPIGGPTPNDAPPGSGAAALWDLFDSLELDAADMELVMGDILADTLPRLDDLEGAMGVLELSSAGAAMGLGGDVPKTRTRLVGAPVGALTGGVQPGDPAATATATAAAAAAAAAAEFSLAFQIAMYEAEWETQRAAAERDARDAPPVAAARSPAPVSSTTTPAHRTPSVVPLLQAPAVVPARARTPAAGPGPGSGAAASLSPRYMSPTAASVRQARVMPPLVAGGARPGK